MTQLSPAKLYVLPLLFCSLLVIVSSLILGLIGHALYWLRYDSFARWRAKNERKLKWRNSQRDDEYGVLIVGTGFSGLGMAIKLNQLGMDNYILIERHAHVGGTWYANTYPGCACDVPSNLYSFSFEPNPNWSHYFSRQPEIRAYLDYCANKYDIRRHIEFETTVTEMRWIEQEKRWQVTTKSHDQERVIYARSVVVGSGPLSNVAYPTDIAGIDQFEGEMCHTATWNAKMDVRGKRVAVIGTGASAIQAVPKIHEMGVGQLLVFQRTPPWVIPRLDRRLHQWEKDLYRRVPMLQKLSRVMLYWATESFALAFAYRWPIRFINQHLVRYYLQQQVKDTVLRRKLTPAFEFGCKRMLLANDWYSTLQQSNVSVVTDRIREVKSRSIVTSDGVEHPVDIIIWSTGFQTQTFPIPVYGTNGCSLVDQWSKTMQAYRGLTVPNFPNFFLLLGPNTGLGHNSIVIMGESQINYIAEAFLYMDQHGFRTLTVKDDAHRAYNTYLQSKLKRSVWQKGGCHSWYQDAKGNNTALWPDFTWVYILLMKRFDAENYRLETMT